MPMATPPTGGCDEQEQREQQSRHGSAEKGGLAFIARTLVLREWRPPARSAIIRVE
jgi:hypothetical protein